MKYESPLVVTIGNASTLVLGGDGPNAECCTCGKHIADPVMDLEE